jgi:hypothetical protein
LLALMVVAGLRGWLVGGGDFVLELFSDASGVGLNGSKAAAPSLLCSAHRCSPALHRQVVCPRR